MGLYAYMQLTQQLLSDVKQEVLNPAFLISFINTARGQLAGESESVRFIGTLSTAASTQSYNYASITAASGAQGVINVRRINYTSGSGQKFVAPLPWEYFDLYYLNNTAPASAAPLYWAQYGQGSTGNFMMYPIPDAVYALKLDCIGYPSALTTDSDTEIIPYPWTDAIPYYAAYLGYLNVQAMDKAAVMFQRYKEFMFRARQFATPSVLPWQYEQYPMPATPINLQVVRSDPNPPNAAHGTNMTPVRQRGGE